MRLVNWRTFAIGVAGFGLAACGDDVTIPPVTPTFQATPAVVSCTVGQVVPLAVNVTPVAQGATYTFAGTPSPAGAFTVAAIGNTNAANVTCSQVGTGVVTVTVDGRSYTVPVTVTQGQNQNEVIGVAVDPPAATIAVGGTRQFTASILTRSGQQATPAPRVTFTSSNEQVARVDSTGLVTGVSPSGNIPVQIIARVQGTTFQASAQVTVVQSNIVASVTPNTSSINLTAGQTFQAGATVTLAPGAPANTPTTVTFRIPAADSAVATVSSTGLVRAGAQGGTTTLTIVSTADTNVRSQPIQVVVQPPQQARISIQDIRASGSNNTIDPTNVAGTINAYVNVDFGSVQPDSVIAILGGLRTTCQTFNSANGRALVRAYRAQITTGAAQIAPVLCSINTAAFDTTSGAANVGNGLQELTIQLLGRIGDSPVAPQATIRRSLTLNNASGFALAFSQQPTEDQRANGAPASGLATGPQGLQWRGGDFIVRVLNVNYAAPGTVTVPTGLTIELREPGAAGALVATQTVEVDTTGGRRLFAATFEGGVDDNVPTLGTDNVQDYTSPAATGTAVVITGATAAVNYLGLNGATSTTAPVVYLDNQAPTNAGAQLAATDVVFPVASQVDATSAFVNGQFGFSAANFLTTAARTAFGLDNGGVDLVRYIFGYRAGTSGDFTTIPGSPQTGAGVPASNVSTAYQLQLTVADALGNAARATSAQTFGVDIGAPQFDEITGPANLAQLNTADAAIGYTNLRDNAAGINPAAALLASVTRLARVGDVSGGDVRIFCDFQATVPAPSSNLATICTTNLLANPFTVTENGYYTVTTQARDRAGNLTAADTRRFVLDDVDPAVTAVGGAPALITGGQNASITNFSATDNLELVRSFLVADFGAIDLAFEGPQIGTLFDNVLTSTVSNLALTFPGVTQVETAATIGAPATLANLSGAVTDAGNNAATGGTIAVPAGNIAPRGTQPASYGARGATGFTLAANPTNVVGGAGVGRISIGGATTGTTANPVVRSATLTANLIGASGTFANPASRVELRYFDTELNAWVRLADLSFSGQTDNGLTRVYNYTGTFAPTAQSFLFPVTGTLAAPTTVRVVAISFAANGDALVSEEAVVNLVP